MTINDNHQAQRDQGQRGDEHFGTKPACLWHSHLPPLRGSLPFGGTLHRTEPSGPCPAPIAVLGLYPALTRTKLFKAADGAVFPVPTDVEARSFVGSSSAKEVDKSYLEPLKIGREHVFFFDLYPYFMANTAVSAASGRSMADNVKLYGDATKEDLAVVPRPPPDQMVALCNETAGIGARVESLLQACRPRLLITLGNEVAAYMLGESRASVAQQRMYGPEWTTDKFGFPLKVVHVAHPGLLSRREADDPWNLRHRAWCAGAGLRLINVALAPGAGG